MMKKPNNCRVPLTCGAYAGSACPLGGHGRAIVVPLLGLLLLVKSAHAAALPDEAVEIASSIILLGDDELGDSSRMCIPMIDAARTLPQSSLNFILTGYWIDEDDDDEPEYYCFRQSCQEGKVCGEEPWPEGVWKCPQANEALIARFRDQVFTCFKHAVHRGFDIRVIAHVDDGKRSGKWRNFLKFDPLERYALRGVPQYSYLEAILYPIADALVKAARPHTKVKFAMQGEMGRTIYAYPKSWKRATDRLRNRLLFGGASQLQRKNVEVGISHNHNKICGCVTWIKDPSKDYAESFLDGWQKVKSEYDIPAVCALYRHVDFFGTSFYPSMEPGFPLDALAAVTNKFDGEAQIMGVSNCIQDAMQRYGLKHHFSEVGIGGGYKVDNSTTWKLEGGTDDPMTNPRIARTAQEAAAMPYFPGTQQCTANSDPFGVTRRGADGRQQLNKVGEYVAYFFKQLTKYLVGQQPGAVYPVSEAYLWTRASYDTQGVYPGANCRNDRVLNILWDHNKQAMKQKGYPWKAPDN